MRRFYISQKISGDTVSITEPAQLHHLRNVLRSQPGDEVTVFDAEGGEFAGVIQSVDRDRAILDIRSRKPAGPKNLEVTIACAIPKKSRMDEIIDKLTQLGVDGIVPLKTERGVVKLDEKEIPRLGRWRKIALSAAEQSQRHTLPLISPVTTLGEILHQAADYDLKLIPTLTGDSRPLNKVLPGAKPFRILALIGPEGDFTPAEVAQALKAGFVPVSLGNTVLRVETAAVAVAAYLKIALTD
jgi:16S rRNA (uracil1498-N3)-methyltransferase